MRLIDADAVLEELKRMEVEMMPAKLAHIYTAVVVEDSPTIDAVPRWIPCKERLPEKKEKAYLVYLDNGHVCECRWWCLDPVFLKPTDNWRWHIMDRPQYTKVLAWMPLPEPYGGERKDDE